MKIPFLPKKDKTERPAKTKKKIQTGIEQSDERRAAYTNRLRKR